MADWTTIASLATAGGTLVLALATFAAVRSANRSARLAEYSMKIGIRPLLMPSRLEDIRQKIMWGDEHWALLEGSGAHVQISDGNVYLAMGTGDREKPLSASVPYTTPISNRFYMFIDKFPASGTVNLDGGTMTGVPFLGEHADLDIRTKLAYLLRTNENTLMFAADSRNLAPEMYRHVHKITGDIDVLFLGMECDGAPLSWVYGPLLTSKLERAMDQSRRLAGGHWTVKATAAALLPAPVWTQAAGHWTADGIPCI